MDDSKAIRWTRLDGTSVPIERLDLHELVAAHQQLLTGSWSAEDTRLLLVAIEHELERRWQRPAGSSEAPGSDQSDETDRAA